MSKSTYSVSDKYILRTPILPLNTFFNLTNGESIEDEKLLQLCSLPVVKEALYLASPVLRAQLDKWLAGNVLEPKEKNSLKVSLLKYLSRMSSRPTPFGLFAGCSVGEFADKSEILLKRDSSEGTRHTRLDMNLVGLLVKKIEQQPSVKDKMLFYPNSSLYSIGERIRYLEYDYKNNRRIYKIVEITTNPYLAGILDLAKAGLTLSALANSLEGQDEISYEEALDFICELVDSQLLVSELEPTVTGDEFFTVLVEKLSVFDSQGEEVAVLRNMIDMIKAIDSSFGNMTEMYHEVINEAMKLGVEFDIKDLFQVDLTLGTSSNSLTDELKAEILEGLQFLNRVSFPVENGGLNDFKKEFRKRYDNRVMDLSHVMDNEVGIGYPVGMNGDSNSLLNSIPFKQHGTSHYSTITWSKLDAIILQKFLDFGREGEQSIVLTDADISGLSMGEQKLPTTFSVMANLARVGQSNKIVFNSIGGSSAANLLARFTHSDNKIHDFVNEIMEYEERWKDEATLLAEIVHLPEDRIGNILMRSSQRLYEIPFMCASTRSSENQISIEDMTIQLVNDSIVLRSKSKNKRILPRLTNAHNYVSNSLPVYRFLAELQCQGLRPGLKFEPSIIYSELEYIPRIEYKSCILSLARWLLKSDEIVKISALAPDKKADAIAQWREKHKLPAYVVLVEGDNKLLINTQNTTSIDMLASATKKMRRYILNEFLYDPVVSGGDEVFYSNEFIFSIFNQN